MRRKPLGPLLLVLLALLVLIMPVWQMFDWMKVKNDKERTTVLLYQVTLFQMEMLESAMNSSDTLTTTALDEWRRAAFAALYAHERLSRAVGSTLPAKLEGVDALLQWILRAQVGGSRTLSKEEAELLTEAPKSYRLILEAYGSLMNGDGNINGASSVKLKKADIGLAELVKKKLK